MVAFARKVERRRRRRSGEGGVGQEGVTSSLSGPAQWPAQPSGLERADTCRESTTVASKGTAPLHNRVNVLTVTC